MTWWAIGAIVLGAVLLGAVCAATGVFLNMLLHPKKWDKSGEFRLLASYGFDGEGFYNGLDRKPFSFRTSRGNVLQGEILPPKPGTAFKDGRQRAVILLHGYTASRWGMLAFAELFHRMGFSVIIYDQRYHGESVADFCTMGYLEHMDCIELAEHLRTQFPADTLWGLLGESMGAATVMMAAPELPWLSFVCEDCGYTTLRKECRASIKYKAGLPGEPFTFLTSLLLPFAAGYRMSQVRPIDTVGRISQPMLFNHGGTDRYVPTKMIFELYEKKQGTKKMNVFPEVPHARSSVMRREEYYELLREFLEENGILP